MKSTSASRASIAADIGLLRDDLLGDPGLAVLVVEQDLQERIHGGDVRAVEQSDKQRAAERQSRTGPGRATRIARGEQNSSCLAAPKKGDPRASMPSQGPRGDAGVGLGHDLPEREKLGNASSRHLTRRARSPIHPGDRAGRDVPDPCFTPYRANRRLVSALMKRWRLSDVRSARSGKSGGRRYSSVLFCHRYALSKTLRHGFPGRARRRPPIMKPESSRVSLFDNSY